MSNWPLIQWAYGDFYPGRVLRPDPEPPHPQPLTHVLRGLNMAEIDGTKRIDIVEDAFMDDWFVATSPRSGGAAEGYWCQWVHVARQILAAEQTKERMPEHYRAYDNPRVYSEHHPDCPAAPTPDPDMEVDP